MIYMCLDPKYQFLFESKNGMPYCPKCLQKSPKKISFSAYKSIIKKRCHYE